MTMKATKFVHGTQAPWGKTMIDGIKIVPTAGTVAGRTRVCYRY